MSKDNSNIAISVSNLSKRYLIGNKKDGSLRGTLGNLFAKKNSDKNEFWALKDINFEIEKGDVIGIIGKNGAGKSTLLKLLSQITTPTTGRIEINGRVASLLEVGTGFHPELTGRENIFLNGTILGMTRKEVQAKFDEIVAFSGVEKFIDTPVKRYSSGMYVRLAFSVAAHLEPEILVIDEVLAVGDAEFQKKCLGKMQDVAGQGRTVLFVSHNMAAVKNLCNKGIYISNGKVIYQGSIENAIESYLNSGYSDQKYVPSQIDKNLDVSYKSIEILDINNKPENVFTCSDKIKLKFELNQKNNNHGFNLFVIIKNQFGAPVFSAEKKIEGEELTLIIEDNFLTRGSYHIHSFIHIPRIKQFDVAEDVCNFKVEDSTSEFAIHGDYDYGSVFGKYNWENDK